MSFPSLYPHFSETISRYIIYESLSLSLSLFLRLLLRCEKMFRISSSNSFAIEATDLPNIKRLDGFNLDEAWPFSKSKSKNKPPNHRMDQK